MIDRRMPDAWEDLRDRKAEWDKHFRTGFFTLATYRLTLAINGFTEAQIKDELRDRLREMGNI